MMTPIHINNTLAIAYEKCVSTYELNLSAYDACYTKEPDITVTPTTPTTTILLAAYEISFTAYQLPVIAYDPYQVTLPYTKQWVHRSRLMLTIKWLPLMNKIEALTMV